MIFHAYVYCANKSSKASCLFQLFWSNDHCRKIVNSLHATDQTCLFNVLCTTMTPSFGGRTWGSWGDKKQCVGVLATTSNFKWRNYSFVWRVTSKERAMSSDDVGTQVSLADIKAARERINGYIHYTPVMRCSYLDSIAGLQLHFKCENFQKTGSFKVCAWQCDAVSSREGRRPCVLEYLFSVATEVAHSETENMNSIFFKWLRRPSRDDTVSLLYWLCTLAHSTPLSSRTQIVSACPEEVRSSRRIWVLTITTLSITLVEVRNQNGCYT